MNLLDKIQLENGREYSGIIDFVNTKHVYFFDMTNNCDVDPLIMIILWKGYNPELRFSVWAMMNHPHYQLPQVLLLPQKNIINQVLKPTVISRGKKIKHIFKVESII